MQLHVLLALSIVALGLAGAVFATNSSAPTNKVHQPLDSKSEEATEATRERFRRLIPYMTFYFSQQQFGDRPNFQQISGAGHAPSSSANNLFTPTDATYSSNGHLGGAQFVSNGHSVDAQYSNGANPFANNNVGTAQYTSNNIAAFLAPYLTKQANNNAGVFTNNQQQRPSYNNYPSLSYSSNNIVSSGGVPYNVGKSLAFNGKTPSYRGQDFIPAGTVPTYPANHARPTETTLFSPSNPPVLQNEQNYVTAEPAYIAPSQSPLESYRRPINGPSQNLVNYRNPVAIQSRPSAADTLSQILDLLRAAGRLPPLEDSPIYTQLPSTPVQDPALYRVPSTTPAPKPIQSLDEDDYAYYDDDDVQKPVLPSPKATPFQLPAKLTPGKANLNQNYPPPEGGTPGRPGVDYPILYKIPETSFDCKTQRYKGFFGDPDTNCQVWHYCDLNGGQASFLCPNGTIFSQVGLTCDWWFNVKCESTVQLYVLNERLYKYILPVTPSFPEDYHGPIVDRYLELKFREKELKEEEKRKQAAAVAMVESNTAT